MRCPLCGSNDTKKLFDLDKRTHANSFSIIKCKTCEIAWTYPLPNEKEIPDFYPEEYHGKLGKHRFMPLMERLVLLSRKKRAREIIALNSGMPGKILDIGCGRGWMLSMLKEWGWEVSGTELSKESSSFARDNLKLNIHIKDLFGCSFPLGYFDVLTLWHVLEHLPKPILTLKEINRVLKKNGALIIEVPNFGGLQAKLFRNKWFHLDSPRHLFHFNEKVLKKSLEDSGFDIIKTRNLSWEYDLFGFVQSTLNIISFKFDYLYNFLRTTDGRMLKGNPLKYSWDILAGAVFAPILLIISLPVVLISSLFGMGGIIRYQCIKRYDLNEKV